MQGPSHLENSRTETKSFSRIWSARHNRTIHNPNPPVGGKEKNASERQSSSCHPNLQVGGKEKKLWEKESQGLVMLIASISTYEKANNQTTIPIKLNSLALSKQKHSLGSIWEQDQERKIIKTQAATTSVDSVAKANLLKTLQYNFLLKYHQNLKFNGLTSITITLKTKIKTEEL